MRILFISNDLIGGNLSFLLKQEGHDVKLYIKDKKRRKNLINFVKQTNNWKGELSWVGKNGLIIFDDVGYGKIQDNLRKRGFTVFGGSESGERLETDRDYGQKIFKKYGLRTFPLIDFPNVSSAIRYAKKNRSAWVIKQNSHHYSKTSNYVGKFSDGRDVIDMLTNYELNSKVRDQKISLHQRISGVEIGIGRFFNGNDWVGPIEFNIEYPRFFPGDIGPMTSEMGTLAWYSDDENNRLYKEVLLKLKPFLQITNFRGDFEINCIVNKNGAFPLEATARIGSPIIHLQTELHYSPWGEFLYAIAKGNSYELKWKEEYGIVVLGAVPPFPYVGKLMQGSIYGAKIYFDNCSKKDLKHIHFEEVSKKGHEYYVSDTRGYVLYVTSSSSKITDAQKKVYDILQKICIPKLFYRNDIGQSFIENKRKLEQWGYL